VARGQKGLGGSLMRGRFGGYLLGWYIGGQYTERLRRAMECVD
jgi:hypothetical protein